MEASQPEMTEEGDDVSDNEDGDDDYGDDLPNIRARFCRWGKRLLDNLGLQTMYEIHKFTYTFDVARLSGHQH